MTTRELAIEAYKVILDAKKPLRSFADFRYAFEPTRPDDRNEYQKSLIQRKDKP